MQLQKCDPDCSAFNSPGEDELVPIPERLNLPGRPKPVATPRPLITWHYYDPAQSYIEVIFNMSTPRSTGATSPVVARVPDKVATESDLPEILPSPPKNRHRDLDTRDDRIGDRASALSHTGGADQRLPFVPTTDTRHPYTLPPIESFASRADSLSSRSSYRPRGRSRSRTKHMDGLGEWSMMRPEGAFPDLREASSAPAGAGYSMSISTGERGGYPQTWSLPASTLYSPFNQPPSATPNQPYRAYLSPTMTPLTHSPTSLPQPGFPDSNHTYNPQVGSHLQSGHTVSGDEGFPTTGIDVKRARGNSDPTSDNSGIMEAPWLTTTLSPIVTRPYTHRPDPRRSILTGQSGPLSSPIPSTGFETIGGSRPGSRQGDVMLGRTTRLSVPFLGVPSIGGTWHDSSTPNIPDWDRMLPGDQHGALLEEPPGHASGSSWDQQVQARSGSSKDQDRPRKRAKTRVNSAESGKKTMSRTVRSSDVQDQISTYCDELCDLARGNAQGESSANASRLSDLSRKIVLQLSAIASEAGLKDLVVTEEDLTNGLRPLAIEDTNKTNPLKANIGSDSLPAPIPGAKSVTKPNSVLNFQTPQEAARDMKFIRMRRDELNAKAAAAEREKGGREREESESAMQVDAGKVMAHNGLVPDEIGQGYAAANLPDHHQAILTGNPLATSPSLIPGSQTTPPETASMPPTQRQPFRYSTYQPFMPFPYVSTQGQGALGLYSEHMNPNSMALANIALQSTPSRSCHSCGIMHATEWKTGPDGPETLCAVCGFHWLRQGQAWALLPGYKVSFQVGEAL